MEEPPGPALEKLQIFEKEGAELQVTSHAAVDKYYEALVAGDLQKVRALTDQYLEDVNMVFNISQNELQWQVKSQAAFGLSGILDFKDHFHI